MKNLLVLLFLFAVNFSTFQERTPSWDFDAQLQHYFAAQTEEIQRKTEAELSQAEITPTYLAQARTELQDMLGLLPFPEKTPLQAKVTGIVEHEEFTVEKIHFQSMPGLYVTGNLYIPKNLKGKVPAIIYVCGHATVKEDGYNFGAKVHYQHHPAWFARHGYVCLILDTLQLGEIEGIHHGLHRYDRWWWISRGYTPAGVEAWNGIRAIDYLLSRQEVAPDKIGITGRSGGGITSWWVAALDDRIKVAVPVAGITDMEDHVVNGCIEGHCDCMYMFNTYRWDFPKVAALVAPRPLLISNTDRDPIFPIEGVFRVYRQVRRVYESMDAGEQCALNITSGPHQDVQELRIHAFRWFDHYLYDREDLIEKPAVKFFTPEQLRVFEKLPEDQINTRMDETFNAVAPSLTYVLQHNSWEVAEAQWKNALAKVFNGWPQKALLPGLEPVNTQNSPEAVLTTFALQSDEQTTLPVFHLEAVEKPQNQTTRLIILDDENWPDWSAGLAELFPEGHFWKDLPKDGQSAAKVREEILASGDLYLISIRGAGPARFSGNDFKQTQIRKRFYLLGQSLQSMQTWDVRQALNAVLPKNSTASDPLYVHAGGLSAGMALYASIFIENELILQLTDLPSSHMEGPYYPRILRYLDMPAAVMLAGEMHQVNLINNDPAKDEAWGKALKLINEFPQISVRAGR